MSQSYGHAYLTSYGWAGTGTGLRKGTIERPLAIPPKKNLCGVGKDRDEAFPFWDHLFAAASKAITIKVSSDDEDVGDIEDPSGSSHTDPGSIPLWRTTTGIISNRRPAVGTPASTSGSATPNLNTNVDAASRLSLLATAKREAAKRGLYARFFRGPVLGPDDDLRADTASHLVPSSSESSVCTPVPERVVDTETLERKNRKLGEKVETEEERRERKRLKKERKIARAAKKAEKALAGEKAREKKDRLDRKARKHWDEETQDEENGVSQYLKKASKQAQKPVARSPAGEDPEPPKCTRKRLKEEEPASTNNGQQDTSPRRLPNNVDATDVILTTRKKKKRKDTPS